MKTPSPVPSLDQLRRAYPTLQMLEAEAEDFQGNSDPHFCANNIWYGHDRRQQSLRSRTITIADKAVKRFGQQQAYDVVYSGVYEKLPDCRACGCFNPEALI